MKEIECVVIGYGDRGSIYADYCYRHNNDIKVIAVVEPDLVRLKNAEEKFNISRENCFVSIQDFINSGLKCDFVINATMDSLHYKTTKQLLENRYNVLLEKPITSSKKELISLYKLSIKYGVKLFICHVLRYTPFYSAIKNEIDSGSIGNIISIEQNEHVWAGHFITSFIRGKWRSEKECHVGLLLAKCCHDMDLMCWLNNKTKPTNVSSFGERATFIKEKAPFDATKYCLDCNHYNDCIYSVKHYNFEHDYMPFITWQDLDMKSEDLTEDIKVKFLKQNNAGECVYKIKGDLVDRQNVIVKFDNNSIGTLNMIGGSAVPERNIHIVGTKGEIKGLLEDKKFSVKYLKPDTIDWFEEKIVDVSENVLYGHSGGDEGMMQDIVNYFTNKSISNRLTSIEDSLKGHLLVYSAEKSRKKSKTMKIKGY